MVQLDHYHGFLERQLGQHQRHCHAQFRFLLVSVQGSSHHAGIIFHELGVLVETFFQLDFCVNKKTSDVSSCSQKP